MPASGRSRRAWGWHRLTDEWAARIVAEAQVRPGELVLDVGAGEGALTGHLMAAGARVLAIELHPGRAEKLRRLFGTAPVTVVQADAYDLRLPRRPFRVVANPAYHLSSSLLRTLLDRRSQLTRADLVLQRAFVNRAVAEVSFQRRWHLYLGRPLPRRAFLPPPQVDSAVLVIRRR